MNLLVLPVGIKSFLLSNLRKELHKNGEVLVGTDLLADVPAKKEVDFFYQAPKSSSPAFEPFILEILKKHKINTILSVRQQDFVYWTEFVKKHKGYKILLSGEETIKICGNKKSSYDWLKKNNFPVSTYTLKCKNNFENVRKILGPTPWFSKPVSGSHSYGLSIVNDIFDFEKLPEDSIIQPLLKGDEYTINCYVDRNRKCRAVIPHLRIEVSDGEVSVGVTVKNDYLMRLGKEISEKLPDSYGPLCFQLIHDKAKGPLGPQTVALTDLNARFGGGYPLTHAAGGNFVEWLILEAKGKPLPQNAEKWEEGVKFMRNNGNFMFAHKVAKIDTRKPLEVQK